MLAGVAAPAPATMTGTIYLDALSVSTKHCVYKVFEGLQPDCTFEYQFVQHFEGMPTSASQYLETATSTLHEKYPSALDILRRIDIRDFRVGRNLNID